MGTRNDTGSFAVSWQRLVALFIPLALLVTALPARTPVIASDLPVADAQPAAAAPQASEPTPKSAALPAAAAVSPPASYDALHNCASSSTGWTRFAGHGVNVVCGNFVAQNVDLSVAGRSLSFAFVRTYNAADLRDGPLGFGWTHSYNMALVVETGGSVLVRTADGRQDRFTPNGSGYTPPPGVFSTLVANADRTFTLIQRDQGCGIDPLSWTPTDAV